MDIFDVLNEIMEKKTDFIKTGLNENKAILRAEFDVSRKFNIPIVEIKKFCRS